MNIEVIIRRLFQEVRLRAIASVTLDGMIAIHEIKVFQGKERLFVAMPSRKEFDGVFRDIVHPVNQMARQMIDEAVLKAYHACLKEHPFSEPKPPEPEPEIMKAITTYQPWATLLSTGIKLYETRSWATNYRGPIAIHAGRKPFLPAQVSQPVAQEFNRLFPWGMDKLPLGFVIATAELVDCHLIDEAFRQTLTETERLLGGLLTWTVRLGVCQHERNRAYSSAWLSGLVELEPTRRQPAGRIKKEKASALPNVQPYYNRLGG